MRENFAVAVPLHADILRGCRAIAGYYFGDEGKWRAVNHLCANRRFPHFRHGNLICVRARTIDRWIGLQERMAVMGKRLRAEDIIRLMDEDDDADN